MTDLTDLTIAGRRFKLEALTLAGTSAESLQNEADAIFALFLEREAEFGVHPSVLIDYPDLSDGSKAGFLSDAAAYAARRSQSMAERSAQIRVVVLTTYSHLVGPSFVAAGYEVGHIDMPAGPDHTAAFILAPTNASPGGRTLYIEAVNEKDEKIKPSFVLKLTDESGQLCAGACGSIHERDGKRYAYLATMTLASEMPQGGGTAMVERLLQFLQDLGVRTLHLGTQTAGRFYQKLGFEVEHRLVCNLRVRQQNGQEILGDLVMLSKDIARR